MKLTSSDLEMTFDKGGDQWVGLRFTNVQIPAGATITDAFVQFQADESDTVVTTLVVHGEAHADSAPFVDVPGDISGRPRTVAVVNWAPAAWATAGEAGIDQRTPNLGPDYSGDRELGGLVDWQRAGNHHRRQWRTRRRILRRQFGRSLVVTRKISIEIHDSFCITSAHGGVQIYLADVLLNQKFDTFI